MGAISDYLKKHNLKDYDAYLASDHWQQFRKLLIGIQPVCCGCKNGPPTEVHHVNYSHIGRESPDECLPLCGRCHEWIHKLLDEKFPGLSIETTAPRTGMVFEQATGNSWSDAKGKWCQLLDDKKIRRGKVVTSGKKKCCRPRGTRFKKNAACRDCGDKSNLPKWDFYRTTPPRCSKCGGMLVRAFEYAQDQAYLRRIAKKERAELNASKKAGATPTSSSPARE